MEARPYVWTFFNVTWLIEKQVDLDQKQVDLGQNLYKVPALFVHACTTVTGNRSVYIDKNLNLFVGLNLMEGETLTGYWTLWLLIDNRVYYYKCSSVADPETLEMVGQET